MCFIANAVAPAKADAAKQARDRALAMIGRCDAEVAANGPVPRGRDCWDQAQNAKHKFFCSIWKAEGHINNKVWVKYEAGRQFFIDEMVKDAEARYDAFVVKLIDKIGEGVIAAELVGNHVWGYSVLHVEFEDGRKEAWKTQSIVNYSKFGRPFNQYPSRKVKK